MKELESIDLKSFFPKDYIEAKMKYLTEAGFIYVTQQQLKYQIQLILNNEPNEKLSVIGLLVKADLIQLINKNKNS